MTFADPYTPCKVGFFNDAHRVADTAIFSDGFTASYMFINSKVLREALLSNPKYLQEKLGLIVTDVNALPKVEPNKVEAVPVPFIEEKKPNRKPKQPPLTTPGIIMEAE